MNKVKLLEILKANEDVSIEGAGGYSLHGVSDEQYVAIVQAILDLEPKGDSEGLLTPEEIRQIEHDWLVNHPNENCSLEKVYGDIADAADKAAREDERKKIGDWLNKNAYAKTSVESGRIIRNAIETLLRGESIDKEQGE